MALSWSLAACLAFTPTAIGSWAPLLHWQCRLVSEDTTALLQLPDVLLNSPFDGKAWANVTTPAGFLEPGTKIIETDSINDTNGGADWDGFQSRVTVFTTRNVSVWGAGPNVHCDARYAVLLAPTGNEYLGIPIIGPGNTSDSGEPTTLTITQMNLTFQNGFNSSNAAAVTTCDGVPRMLATTATHLTVWISFRSSGNQLTLPFQIPLVDCYFDYWFPANGTWEMESLSAPGGPGGGLAFSYSPYA